LGFLEVRNMLLAIEGVSIIGREWGNAFGVLGAIRSPGWISEGIGGFLFESQWLYWFMTLGIGAACWEMGRRRADARLRSTGFGIVALVVVWVMMAFVVVTPKERLYAAHVGMARAAKEGDVGKIVGYLREPFRSSFLGVEGNGGAREAIERELRANGVKGTLITFYESDIEGKGATTHVTLLTETEVAGPVKTSWILSWDDVPGEDWKIGEADLVRVGDENVSH
jgi:hypothetical protein